MGVAAAFSQTEMTRAVELARRALSWLPVFRTPDYSRLYVGGDKAGWVLDWEMRELAGVCARLGVEAHVLASLPGPDRQCLFLAHSGSLEWALRAKRRRRLGASYFHGRPDPREPWAAERLAMLARLHEDVDRLQVTNTAFRDVILETGISPAKVFLIPIGVNLDFFPPQTPGSRRAAREARGIPDSAVVVGSFQKDGVGWGDGLEPKLVKGPDVLLGTLAILRQRVPELWVLLSGPSRGYVKAGLERLNIPYTHVRLDDYTEMGRLYDCLDTYIVSSRDEGGPKAVLESMATGVPLVTTRVGQAADLVEHGKNGWMVDVDDADGLADWAFHALELRSSLDAVMARARQTAELNSYRALDPLWRDLLSGFVAPAGDT